jgi:hypothetical protein
VDRLSEVDKTARAYESQIAIFQDMIDKEAAMPRPNMTLINGYNRNIAIFEKALDALKKSGAKTYLNAPSISVMKYIPEISSFGGLESGGRISMHDAADKTPEVANPTLDTAIKRKQRVIVLEGFSGVYKGDYVNGISRDSMNLGG